MSDVERQCVAELRDEAWRCFRVLTTHAEDAVSVRALCTVVCAG
eukprot:COSAG02_NODE_435_length_22393_cov_18.805643_15_plen_44_part_00